MSKCKPFLFNQNLITNGTCTIQWWREGREGREWREEERGGRKEGDREGKRERGGGRDIP